MRRLPARHVEYSKIATKRRLAKQPNRMEKLEFVKLHSALLVLIET